MAQYANLNKRMSILKIIELDKGVKSNFLKNNEDDKLKGK